MSQGAESIFLPRAYEGRVFAGYRIARVIATGGMATVYLARRTGPGRFAQTAALKVIHPHLVRERAFVDMFLEEARLASSINHPNVCRVLDFGEAEGTYYLAMEYVRGETWATTLNALYAQREGRARLWALSAYVIAQACEGLHAAHEAVGENGYPLNIVHRDISPQNLFVAYDGSVRVLDFGIASANDKAEEAASNSELAKGRYAYMAPEQVRGLDVDRRADIWSLGVVLREALSGQRLFARDTQVATILAVTRDPLPPWPKHVPLLLREICDRALDRDPEQRFASAREMGSAIGRILSSEMEPVSGAELARFMRQLFPLEIARKRAELRELAGDDANTGTFTSVIPLNAQSTGGLTLDASEERPVAEASTQRRGLRWGLATLGALLAAFAAFEFTPRLLEAPAATPFSVPLEVREQGASAEAPEGTLPPAHALPLEQAAAPATGVEEAPDSAEASEDAQESLDPREAAREARRARRRARRLARAAMAMAQGESAETAAVEAPQLAEARGPGTVVIGAEQGWAEVSLAGKKLGTTPLRTQLPAGTHALEVRFFGTGSPRVVPVDVRAGETTKLRLTQ